MSLKDLTIEKAFNADWTEDEDLTSTLLFEHFFDTDVFTLIEENTNLYASQQANKRANNCWRERRQTDSGHTNTVTFLC